MSGSVGEDDVYGPTAGHTARSIARHIIDFVTADSSVNDDTFHIDVDSSSRHK